MRGLQHISKKITHFAPPLKRQSNTSSASCSCDKTRNHNYETQEETEKKNMKNCAIIILFLFGTKVLKQMHQIHNILTHEIRYCIKNKNQRHCFKD